MVCILDKTKKLYRDNSCFRRKFKKNSPRIKGYKESIKSIRGSFEGDLNLDTLEHSKRREFVSYDLHKLLESLPYKTIVNEFGEKYLAWMFVEESDPDDNQLIAPLQNLTSYDADLLKKIKGGMWSPFFGFLGQEKFPTLRTYDMVVEFKTGKHSLSDIDLESLLDECKLENVELSRKRIKDYKLEIITPKSGSYGIVEKFSALDEEKKEHFGIYMDGPIGMVLLYKNDPNAVSCFVPEDSESLIIYQLQGIKPFRKNGEGFVRKGARGLAPLDWKRLMVRCTEELGKNLSFRKSTIRAAKRLKVTSRKFRMFGEGMSVEDAKKIYDNTALRLGYVQGQRGDWYKCLS